MRQHTHEVKYNDRSIGKLFFNREDALNELRRLNNKGLYGYTLDKI